MLNDNDEDLFPELVAPPEQPVEYEESEDISQHIPEEPIEEQEEIVQHVEPKEILKKNDIFISKPSSKKKIKVENNDEPEEGEPLDIVPVKKPRKKRVMTEEHKAKLALARQKGMETRMRNAELRRQEKEKKLKEKEDNREEKEIIKAVRRKRIQKLKKELDSDEDEPIEKPKPRKEPEPKVVEKIIEKGYTQDDINAAINAALEKQEASRKARKAIKKKEIAEKQHQERVFKTVSRAVDPNDVWANCFN